MLKQYFIMFVLVMIMVKTNAQSPYYYYGNQKVLLEESDQQLFLVLDDEIDIITSNLLLNEIDKDNDFQLLSEETNYLYKYAILIKSANAIIDKEEVVNRYANYPGIISASFTFNNPDGSFMAISNEVIVYAKDGMTFEDVQSTTSQYKWTSIRRSEYNPKRYILSFENGTNILEVANALHISGNFSFAEPNFIGAYQPGSLSSSICSAPPLSDTYFPDQWALYNDGSSAYYQSGYQWSDINACHAWGYTTGSSDVRIAVVDDGVDMDHADIDDGSTPSGWSITTGGIYAPA